MSSRLRCVETRIYGKLRRYDVGPLVQDSMQFEMVLNIEDRGRSSTHTGVDILTDAFRAIFGDPRPEGLAGPCDLRWTFRTRIGNDEKKHRTSPLCFIESYVRPAGARRLDTLSRTRLSALIGQRVD